MPDIRLPVAALGYCPTGKRDVGSSRRRWCEQVNRMPDIRLPVAALVYCPTGKRDVGRPRRRWCEHVNRMPDIRLPLVALDVYKRQVHAPTKMSSTSNLYLHKHDWNKIIFTIKLYGAIGLLISIILFLRLPQNIFS